MIDGTTRYAPYGKLRTLVGANADTLFAASDTHVVAIGVAGGLIRWASAMPPLNGPRGASRGRGTLVGEWVVMPGERELLVFDGTGKRAMRRIPMPGFGASREPLAGSCNLVASGPWLAVGFAGGIEVYGTGAALRRLAASATSAPLQAQYLTLAGDLPAAEAVLVAALRETTLAGERRLRVEQRLLGIVRERATELVRTSQLPAALAALDAIGPLVVERPTRLDWHLLRVELCKQGGDLSAHEAEQERLYACIEGRG
jgi:hypothetical protein